MDGTAYVPIFFLLLYLLPFVVNKHLHILNCYQRSYCTLGPVSAYVGDCLWTGKPPRRGTRHPGQLSLSLPRLNKYPA